VPGADVREELRVGEAGDLDYVITATVTTRIPYPLLSPESLTFWTAW
jgi:hypothetical protein